MQGHYRCHKENSQQLDMHTHLGQAAQGSYIKMPLFSKPAKLVCHVIIGRQPCMSVFWNIFVMGCWYQQSHHFLLYK